MEHIEIGSFGDVPIRTPKDQGYRWCSQCGAECEPEPTAVKGLGVRFVFTCSEHGLNSVVDPFEDMR